MKRQYQILAVVIFAFLLGTAILTSKNKQDGELKPHIASEALAAKFDYLSQNDNSSCSANFQKSIPQMTNTDNIRGSCCSPMSLHRYSEQVEGLKKYGNIPEIPPGPYDIGANLAKRLMSYYDVELTPEE
ncbi:MAG: hypothetical protein G01um101466_492 [Parcubacteria group bacterium Gr01-1014_66]|nr:MAG: hypothetical protein G01um101466_492 [Parcubacteria group bacterium Gr01-1014_66]